jgi:hypothetical protein
MFDPVMKVDRFIIDRLQRLTDRLQRTFGIRASSLVRGAVVLAFVQGVMSSHPVMTPALIAGNVWSLLQDQRRRSQSPDASAQIATFSDTKLGAIMRVGYVWVSLTCLPYDVLWTFVLPYDATTTDFFWFEFVTLAHVLHACRDLPTSKSTVRRWLEGLFTVRKPGLVTSGADS